MKINLVHIVEGRSEVYRLYRGGHQQPLRCLENVAVCVCCTTQCVKNRAALFSLCMCVCGL